MARSKTSRKSQGSGANVLASVLSTGKSALELKASQLQRVKDSLAVAKVKELKASENVTAARAEITALKEKHRKLESQLAEESVLE